MLKKLLLATAPALALAVPAPAAARTITWSGYSWDVRGPGFGGPGPNRWSDAESNVRVEGSQLVLAVARDALGGWTSAEVANQTHLGYGTYRWVVGSDLSALDAHDVLGMFTYGGGAPSNNELDIEPSRWGRPAGPTGSATVWEDAAAQRRSSRSFAYSARPPYTNQFTWEPGRVRYRITDAVGAALLDWTVTSGVPVPSTEVPLINFWRYRDVAPAAERSVRLSSFSWTPLPVCGSLRLRAGHLRWQGARGATVRLRMVRGSAHAVHVVRRLPTADGTLKFTARVLGRRVRPGRYRLSARLLGGDGERACAPVRGSVTVPRR